MSGKETLCSRLPPRRRDPQRSHRKLVRGDTREASRVLIAPVSQARRIRRCSTLVDWLRRR